ENDLAGVRRLEEFEAGAPTTPFEAREMEPNDPAAILYTSGTTGRQKGATLSHGNLVSNTFAAVHSESVTPEDRLLLNLPLFHVFGQNAILNAALQGAATVVLQRRYDPQGTHELIERQRVTMFYAVPSIYIGMLDAVIEPRRLLSVRFYFSVATPLIV